MARGLVTMFLCGDVMLGRGVDQILPHPGDPQLREGTVDDARQYVRLAELTNGAISLPVSFSWPWGEALEVLDGCAPDGRVINLETSVTRSGDFSPGKAVHYRMNPANLPSLLAARPDACALANNHALDFGHIGLLETLDVLAGAGLRVIGAGRDVAGARQPATVPVPGGGRIVVFSFGAATSGIPPGWAATATRPGVALLRSLSDSVADELINRVRDVKRPGDVVVVSIHWGSNWGYEVDGDQVRFARRLIDGGVDVIHGHSSSPATHRGVSRQTRPLRLRRPHRRLRGHPRLRRFPGRPASAVPRLGRAGNRHAGVPADGADASKQDALAAREHPGRRVAARCP